MRTWSVVTFAAAVVFVACGTATPPAPAPSPAKSSGESVSAQLENAPLSPRNANYDIKVRLEPSDRSLHGRETIHWRNISTNPTIVLHVPLSSKTYRHSQHTPLRMPAPHV